MIIIMTSRPSFLWDFLTTTFIYVWAAKWDPLWSQSPIHLTGHSLQKKKKKATDRSTGRTQRTGYSEAVSDSVSNSLLTHHQLGKLLLIRYISLAHTIRAMDQAPLLHGISDEELVDAYGDYLPARGMKNLWKVFCIETVKLWEIGGPIAFQIICQFGINIITSMFVGHLGNVELSSVSIAQSVISTFAFGFMVRLFPPFLSTLFINQLALAPVCNVWIWLRVI